jgi:nucleoside-diphosphate kinase
MLDSIKNQKTLIILKPDAVKRRLVGDIIARIEKANLDIVGIKMYNATLEQISEHYPMSDQDWVTRVGHKSKSGFESNDLDPMDYVGTTDPLEIGRQVVSKIPEYIMSGPIVAIVAQGPMAVSVGRKIIGSTQPHESPVGTVRGDYSTDSALQAQLEGRSIFNLIHASETVEEATKEIKIWFGE